MKVIILLTILVLGQPATILENPCGIMTPRGGDEDWGIGAFVFPKHFNMELFHNGDFFGTLNTYHSGLELIDRQSHGVRFNMSDFEYLGSSDYKILKVKALDKDGHAIIFWKTVDRGIKVGRSVMESKGAIFFSYKELLQGTHASLHKLGYKQWANAGINIEKSCLNLRTLPDENSSKILCVLGNDWEKGFATHLEILEFNGDWAKVTYTEQHPPLDLSSFSEDCRFIEKNKQVGWVKAIDKSGFPNIWFSVTSY